MPQEEPALFLWPGTMRQRPEYRNYLLNRMSNTTNKWLNPSLTHIRIITSSSKIIFKASLKDTSKKATKIRYSKRSYVTIRTKIKFWGRTCSVDRITLSNTTSWTLKTMEWTNMVKITRSSKDKRISNTTRSSRTGPTVSRMGSMDGKKSNWRW